jgi:N-acyl amino acid synthase of PEP-CTERM/exosortase system
VAAEEGLQRACQSLRYRVYVEECGFERPEDHPDRRETDPFDDRSIHLAACRGDQVIGTTRLVLNSPLGLPMFSVLKDLSAFNPRSRRLAEVSRLALDPAFRHRAATEVAGVPPAGRRFGGARPGAFASRERREESVVVMGLIYLTFSLSLRIGVDQWLMICEKSLWVMLKRAGILFQPLGEPVDYHGRRIPYLADAAGIGGRIMAVHNATMTRLAEPVGA